MFSLLVSLQRTKGVVFRIPQPFLHPQQPVRIQLITRHLRPAAPPPEPLAHADEKPENKDPAHAAPDDRTHRQRPTDRTVVLVVDVPVGKGGDKHETTTRFKGPLGLERYLKHTPQ